MSAGTFFAEVKHSFADVPVDPETKNINTDEFLLASSDMAKLFDFLGSAAFAPVKNDITGNIKVVREKYQTDPEKFKTLQTMVKDDENLPKKQRKCTISLMWLRRGLEFTGQAIRHNVDNPSEELKHSFTIAYEKTLSKHHGMLVRPIFHLAMKAAPYRKDFYKKLGGEDEAATMEILKPWLSGLEKCVNILLDFYKTGNYET